MEKNIKIIGKFCSNLFVAVCDIWNDKPLERKRSILISKYPAVGIMDAQNWKIVAWLGAHIGQRRQNKCDEEDEIMLHAL